MKRRAMMKFSASTLLTAPFVSPWVACTDDSQSNLSDSGQDGELSDANLNVDSTLLDADDNETDANATQDSSTNLGADSGPPPDPCTNGATATHISGNHGHSLFVSEADILAGTEKIYNIQGLGDHNHTVTITASDFITLSQATSIEKQASFNGHGHNVTVECG